MNAFVSIVGGYKNDGKKEPNLTFWGTRFDCLNDPMDYLFASKVVLPKIKNAVIDMCNSTEEEEINEEVTEDVESFPYIVSFSENKDSDFMWKHYKADICMEIDSDCFTPYLKHNGIVKAFWDSCAYAEEDKIDECFFNKWNDSLVDIKNINDKARYASVYIKRAAFKDEKEWRLYMADCVLAQLSANGDITIGEQPQEVKVKCIRDKDIILYKEFIVPAKALKGIYVNNVDYESFQKVKHHIEILLRMKGFNGDIDIRQTNRYPIE